MAANTDPFRYHVVGDEHVYVTGDSAVSRSQGRTHAHSEGKYVAEGDRCACLG